MDLEILATEPFTGDYFLEEIKGLADATGMDYKVNYVGRMVSFLCSSTLYSTENSTNTYVWRTDVSIIAQPHIQRQKLERRTHTYTQKRSMLYVWSERHCHT